MDTGISNPGTAGKHKLVTVMINASDKNSYLRKQTLNVSAKIIVGADGPMSAIGKLMGSENKKFMLGFQERLQLKYNLLKLSPGKGNLKQCPDSCCGTKMNAAGFYFSPFIKKGYGWIFPKKDYFNVGVGIEQGSSRMLKEIYNLFKNQVLAGDFSLNNAVNSSGAEPGAHAHNGRQIATVLNTITGLIPVSGMTGNPVCENLILAGDAAGLADPLTGAGIYNAVYSARIVSGIIQKSLEKDDLYMLREIISVYKKEFGPSLARSLAGKELQEKSWPVLENLNEKGNEDTGFAMLIKKSWPMFKEYYAST
jgi:digeranylgeranylglycerophospholipid reductase